MVFCVNKVLDSYSQDYVTPVSDVSLGGTNDILAFGITITTGVVTARWQRKVVTGDIYDLPVKPNSKNSTFHPKLSPPYLSFSSKNPKPQWIAWLLSAPEVLTLQGSTQVRECTECFLRTDPLTCEQAPKILLCSFLF